MSGELRLRRATQDDYAAVQELATELTDVQADRRAAFEATLAHPDRIFLAAEVEGEVVGFADLLVYPDVTEGGTAAELMGLIVRADHRRQGIGRALVEEACRLAAARGVEEFRICTEPENRIAQGLYAACGAKLVGVQMEIVLGDSRWTQS